MLHQCDCNNAADCSENEMFITAGKWQLVRCLD